MNSNVNSNAKIISANNEEKYKFGQFISNNDNDIEINNIAKLDDKSINGNIDPVLQAVNELNNKIVDMQKNIIDIQNDGISAKDLDKQLVQALKDLKNYSSFFEQATFQLESKILKTSMNIAKKIISVEIGEQSSQIAKLTIQNILNKIKTASSITIHLNPKDYIALKDELDLQGFIKIHEDENVSAGGVVIASDLGNFDGNIEAKIQTMLESLENL